MQQLTQAGDWLAVRAQTAWQAFKEDERGEGLVSFLIIAVAVAVLALFALGVFEGEVEGRVGDLDFGDTPEPVDPSADGR